ncbi:MAG TPA: hypothetical protein VFC18_10025 [Burkholderiales bacterium]|nr:hypothetical protein [Burkholderiales bacterium]
MRDPLGIFVDVEDHDAHAVGHGRAQPRVVDDVVEPGDEPQLAVGRRIELGRVTDEQQRDRKAKGDPYDVLFQA